MNGKVSRRFVEVGDTAGLGDAPGITEQAATAWAWRWATQTPTADPTSS